MRVACDFMADTKPSDELLLQGLASAAGVFFNYSHELPCFNYRCAFAADSEKQARHQALQQLQILSSLHCSSVSELGPNCSQGANKETDEDASFWDYQCASCPSLGSKSPSFVLARVADPD